MVDIKKRKVFKRTEDKQTINKLINERLLLKPLRIQLPLIDKKIAEIVKVTDAGLAVHFKNFVPPSGPIILTGLIGNYYTEIEIIVIKPIKGAIYYCNTHYLRISSQGRKEPRYPITEDDIISIKRIRIPLSKLEIKGDTIPAEYKKVMEQYMKDKADIADVVNISTFERKSKIHQKVAETGKTFFIADSRLMKSFEVGNEGDDDLINLHDFYGDSLNSERRKMISKGIIGRIVSPIFGPAASDKWLAIGFVDIASKGPFDFMKLMEVKALTFEIVEGICSANQLEVNESQRILDVSKMGMSLVITHKELVNAMLHRPQFTFIIQIKGQVPIHAVGEIKMKKKMEDGSLMIGIKVQGEKGRQEQMVRYYEFIDSLKLTSKPV